MIPWLEDQSARKINFSMTWQVTGICKTLVKWFLVWGTSMDMLGDGLMVLRACMVGMELAKEMMREEDYSSFVMKRSCSWHIHGLKRTEKNNVGMVGNKTEIDFVLVGKHNRKYLKDVKFIPWKLQHRLVVTDIDKVKLKKVVKNEQTF